MTDPAEPPPTAEAGHSPARPAPATATGTRLMHGIDVASPPPPARHDAPPSPAATGGASADDAWDDLLEQLGEGPAGRPVEPAADEQGADRKGGGPRQRGDDDV